MVFNENPQFLLKARCLDLQQKFYCFHGKAEALFKSVAKEVGAVISACAAYHVNGFRVADIFFDKFKKAVHCAPCFDAFIAAEIVAVQKRVKAEFVVIHKKLPFNNLDKKVFPMYNDFGRTFLSGSDNANCVFVREQFALFFYFGILLFDTLANNFRFAHFGMLANCFQFVLRFVINADTEDFVLWIIGKLRAFFYTQKFTSFLFVGTIKL